MSRRVMFSLAVAAAAACLAGCVVKKAPPRRPHRPPPRPVEAAPPPPAAKWVFLGERHVDFKSERDVIPVTGAKGQFRAIQLRVHKRGIKLHDLTVVFGNGERWDVPVRKSFEKETTTRVIDLPGGKRTIRSVHLVYRSRPGSRGIGAAHIRLWGLR